MLEFFSKLSKKEKLGLSIAIGVVLIAFLDRIVVQPIKNRVESLNQKISVCEEELKMDMLSLNEKKAISGEYEKYAQYVAKAGSDEEEVAKILAEVEAIARKSGVQLVDITPQAPREVDFYKEYATEIELGGNMESVMKFLYELNNSPLLLRAQKLRIALKHKFSKNVSAIVLVSRVLVS